MPLPSNKSAHLLHSRHKLLGDVCSNGLIFELQLGVVFGLQWLQDPGDFTVLPGAAALLLMGEVKSENTRDEGAAV